MVDYPPPRLRPILVVAATVITFFAGGFVVGRHVSGDHVPAAGGANACGRGDQALGAAAAAQLAFLVPQRVAGVEAARTSARMLGAAPEVVEGFGRWAGEEEPAYRHALFGATAVKVERREGDRALVLVDGYWLRSADSVNGAGDFTSAMWAYWLVWRGDRWSPSSPPEAATLPGARTHESLAFIRIHDGFSAVPYVHC